MELDQKSRQPSGTCRLGADGWRTGLHWATPERAAELTRQLAGRGPVVSRPYLTLPEINVLARSPEIVNAVADVIGPDIAVEGGFLLIKPPGGDFTVPWHQDGTNDQAVLDPARSVTVWVAITDATAANGALEVVPGSWRHGYLPCHREEERAGQPGRALTTDVPPGSADPVLVPVKAGQFLLMDERLLHRSGRNSTRWPRIGLNLRYVAPGAVTTRAGKSPASLHPVTRPGW